MIASFENPLAIHKNKIETVMIKFIRTTKKLMEEVIKEILEMKSSTRTVRTRRKKSPDSVRTSSNGPGFLIARTTERLSRIK